MIEVFKITHNMYDETVSHLPLNIKANTRGNNYKLRKHSFHYDLRKHYFSARIVNIWNSLPNGYQSTRHTVISSHGHVVTLSTRHKSTHQSRFLYRVNSSQCRYTRRSTSHDFR